MALKSPAFIYLSLVPFITAAIGFGIGGYSNIINISIWIIHSALMIFLFRKIGGRWHEAAAWLFIPWVLFTLFAGFGPPPATAEKWVLSATQQQIRYLILAAGGIIATVGFRLLSRSLPGKYSRIGLTLVYIWAPLFVLNMLYWGFFLTASARYFISNGISIAQRPDWYLTMRELFYWISTVALALSYLATACFAMALKKSGKLKPRACNAYIIINIVAFIFSFIPPSAPAPLDVMGYFVAVPAISFIMPYLIGLNLAVRKKLTAT